MAKGDRNRTGVSPTIREIGALRLNLEDKSIGIDSDKLEAPPVLYDADVAWIEHRTGSLSIYFGKVSRGAERLQSRLEIRYPPEDFLLTFWGNSLDYHARLNEYVMNWAPEARTRKPSAATWQTEKSHSEWVSLSAASHSGTEASIDFYHLSTSALARYARTQNTEGLKVRGVVRVMISTFDLWNLIEDARPLVPQIQATLPEAHKQAAPPASVAANG